MGLLQKLISGNHKMKRLKPFISSLLSCLSLFCYTNIPAQNSPNVIVILSDDAGYNDFECYGGNEIPTPHINTLAKEGTKFTNAYVTASVCAPSRAGLLTGRYQQRFGFEHNMSGVPAIGFSKQDMGLDRKEKTIADYLKSNGYKTIAIGKWHLGNTDAYFPLKRGFDEFYGFKEGHRNFFGYKEKRDEVYALYDNEKIIPEEKITYLTDMFTDKAVSFIEQNKSRPFFIYLAYNAVHTPLQAKESDLKKFSYIKNKDRRTYAAMMASMDEGIGKIIATLKNNGLEKNTLIFFVNDNGGATNNGSDNGILRGMKGSKWEGGIRVAYIMKWPEHIKRDKIYNNSVSTLDVAATVIAAAGNETFPVELDGVNLLPFLSNNKTPHKELFWRRGVAAAVRSGKWKLIRVKSNPVLLFNLYKDKSETQNLAWKYPHRVKKMMQKIEHWEKNLSSPHWYSEYGDENQIIKHKIETVGRDIERKYP